MSDAARGTGLSWDFPYPSQRMPVLARNVVATSQPLAAQAGVRALARGGNAVDAALAAAIALVVLEPTSNGLGGDAFAIVWDGKQLHGLNASGRSPSAMEPRLFRGHRHMPHRGWLSVTVPGAVSAWVELSRRFGRLPLPALFEDAVYYAREGFHVSPVIAEQWRAAEEIFSQSAEFADFRATFLRGGRAPRAGELFRCPDLAQTLEAIALSGGGAFYRGKIAKRIATHARSTGGLLTEEDLAEHRAEWVEPLTKEFAGATLHEIPPNGQGLAAQIALGILEHTPLHEFPPDSSDSVHLQIEAMKLAFADAHRYIADPGAMDVSPAALLEPEYLKRRAGLIDRDRAGNFDYGRPGESDTVYLAAADAQGRMVSFIQSNYSGFGSGIVVPGTGISLQNRACGFTLEEGHPNRVGPRKRPYHTIIPGFVSRGGAPAMAFGVMGGPMQPQGHVQMMVRIFLYGQNPQAAADAPRWMVREEGRIGLEDGFSRGVFEELRARGHEIEPDVAASAFGGAQLIHRLPDGGYCAASEPRKDGQAVGY